MTLVARQINDAGLALIRQWEGLFLTAYHGAADRPGLLTIGYGHTDAAGPPTVTADQTITKQRAAEILRSDLGRVEKSVSDMVKVVLNDNQFAALVSFVFNVGESNFAKSSLLRKLNAGDYASVPSELMKWTRANGKPVQGLVNRRSAEAGLWAKGSFVTSQFVEPEPVAPTVSTTGTTAARVVGTGVGAVTLVSQVASIANGPVASTVEQVKQVIDTGGDVVGTTRDIVAKVPSGVWENTMAFVQSPKFLAAALVIVLLAWGATYYLRVKHEREAAT